MAQMLLTAKFVESVKPTGTRTTYSDTKSPNLVLFVRKSGTKTWAWTGRVQGDLKTITLGTFPLHDLSAARKWADDLTIRRDGGATNVKAMERTPDEVKTDWHDTLTCDKLFALYIEHGVAHLRSKSEVMRIYEKDVKPEIGAKLVKDVDHDLMMGIVRKKFKTAPAMSNAIVAMLSAWFGWASGAATDLTKLDSNPAARLAKLHTVPARKRTLSEYEIGMLFKALGAHRTTSFAEPTTMLLYTGLRLNEVFEAVWSEFDLPKGMWTIPGERMKNKLDHLVPLSPNLVSMLKARRTEQVLLARKLKVQPGKLVWPSRYGDKPLTGFSDWIEKLTAKMQFFANKDGHVIEKWTMHDLRRTFSSHLNTMRRNKRRVVDKDIIERCLAHKQGGVQGVYDRADYIEEKRDALLLWDDWLQAIKDLHEVKDAPLLAAPVLALPAPALV